MGGVVGVEGGAPKAGALGGRIVGSRFPFIFQLRLLLGRLNAARSIAFRVLFQASRASDFEFFDLPSVPLILGPKPTVVVEGGG